MLVEEKVKINDTTSYTYGGWRDDDWDKILKEKDNE